MKLFFFRSWNCKSPECNQFLGGTRILDSLHKIKALKSISAEFFVCPTTENINLTLLKYSISNKYGTNFKTVFFLFGPEHLWNIIFSSPWSSLFHRLKWSSIFMINNKTLLDPFPELCLHVKMHIVAWEYTSLVNMMWIYNCKVVGTHWSKIMWVSRLSPPKERQLHVLTIIYNKHVWLISMR